MSATTVKVPASSSAPRRTKTRAPGVYRSISGKYEIAYVDSTGRRVFQTVDGSFEEAKALRAELIGKVRRGETVRAAPVTFGDFADQVLAELTCRPRTLDAHHYALERHLRPRYGHRKLADITTSDVARLIAEMSKGITYDTKDGRAKRVDRKKPYAAWTIHGTLTTFSVIMGRAASRRHGLIGQNPVAGLERGERPSVSKRTEKRVLSDTEIARLLAVCEGQTKAMIATLAFTGLRIGECLGLHWEDVDTDRGFVHVRRQLGRDRQPVSLKTAAGARDVVLVPQLAQMLREHRIGSPHSQPGDYVFAAPSGKGRDHRTVSRSIQRAIARAKLGDGLSAHKLRDTFASQLIVGLGIDPVRVSKQLGHARPSFTEDAYAHMYEQARHADDLRDRIAAGYGRVLDVTAVSPPHGPGMPSEGSGEAAIVALRPALPAVTSA